MKFNFKIFGFKKPSGQVELQNISPSLTIEDKDSIFETAVKKEAIRALAKDIKYELDCFTWGKDVIDATIAANKMFREQKVSSTDVRTAYPKAMYGGGYFELSSQLGTLAHALAQKWVEDNY